MQKVLTLQCEVAARVKEVKRQVLRVSVVSSVGLQLVHLKGSAACQELVQSDTSGEPLSRSAVDMLSLVDLRCLIKV